MSQKATVPHCRVAACKSTDRRPHASRKVSCRSYDSWQAACRLHASWLVGELPADCTLAGRQPAGRRTASEPYASREADCGALASEQVSRAPSVLYVASFPLSEATFCICSLRLLYKICRQNARRASVCALSEILREHASRLVQTAIRRFLDPGLSVTPADSAVGVFAVCARYA